MLINTLISGRIPPKRTELHEQISDLVRRWIPMLLSRVGVTERETTLLRESVNPHDQLEQASHALKAAIERSGQMGRWSATNAQLELAMLSFVSRLQHAMNLGSRDLCGAQRQVDEIRKELLALIVTGPKPGPIVDMHRSNPQAHHAAAPAPQKRLVPN